MADFPTFVLLDAFQGIYEFLTTNRAAVWVPLLCWIAAVFAYYRRQPGVGAAAGVAAERGRAGGSLPREGFLIEGRNRVFGALEVAIDRLRVRPGSLSLLLFRIDRLDEYDLDRVLGAFRESVREGDLCGLIDGRDLVLGLVGVSTLTARSVLVETGNNLLQVVGGGELEVGFGRTTSGTRGAYDLHTEARQDLRIFGGGRRGELEHDGALAQVGSDLGVRIQ